MSKESRKTYKKPQIKQVKLVVEEAVLGGCKIQQGSAGPEPRKCGHKDCMQTFGS
jgi:hypothetical protein